MVGTLAVAAEVAIIIKGVLKTPRTQALLKGIVIEIIISKHRQEVSNIREKALTMDTVQKKGLRAIILITMLMLDTKTEELIKTRTISKNPRIPTKVEAARLNHLTKVADILRIKDIMPLRLPTLTPMLITRQKQTSTSTTTIRKMTTTMKISSTSSTRLLRTNPKQMEKRRLTINHRKRLTLTTKMISIIASRHLTMNISNIVAGRATNKRLRIASKMRADTTIKVGKVLIRMNTEKNSITMDMTTIKNKMVRIRLDTLCNTKEKREVLDSTQDKIMNNIPIQRGMKNTIEDR
jgi:hypothetical protein